MKHIRMAKTAALAVSLVLVFAFSVSVSLAKEKYEEKFEKTVALAKEGKINISNISGDIEVRTWAQDQVKIQALKISRADSEAKAKENAAKVEIEITQEGNILNIETKYPKSPFGGSVNVSVDYWLWIPEKAALGAKNISGNVDVEGLGGPVDLSAISGDVGLRKAANGGECSTISGDVAVSGVSGDLFLKSVSGDIKATQVKGSVQGETVSGSVEMLDVSEASTVRLKSLSGDVIYRGQINRAGTYSLKSHSGNIKMFLPANSAFEFDAETFSGDITTDFEVKVVGQVSKKEISGVVNGGGASVKVATFSGNVELKKG